MGHILLAIIGQMNHDNEQEKKKQKEKTLHSQRGAVIMMVLSCGLCRLHIQQVCGAAGGEACWTLSTAAWAQPSHKAVPVPLGDSAGALSHPIQSFTRPGKELETDFVGRQEWGVGGTVTPFQGKLWQIRTWKEKTGEWQETCDSQRTKAGIMQTQQPT